MRCYKVSTSKITRYASTAANAAATRNKIVEDTECSKFDVCIEQVEIPIAKQELLEFINELCELSNG